MAKNSKASIGLAALGMAALMPAVGTMLGSTPEVNAACAFDWEMKNASGQTESVNMCDGKNHDGTFASKISDNQIITVDLNNYKGGAFSLVSYGTGVAFQKIVINLTGENEVKDEEGIAFNAAAPLEFTGEGSLKIKALVPIMNGGVYTTKDYQVVTVPEILKQYMPDSAQKDSYLSEVIIKPSAAETPVAPTEKPEEKPEEKPTETPDETEKPEVKPEEEEKTVWTPEMIAIHVAAGIYIILSLAGYILLGIRKIARKHRPTETKKIVIEENEIVSEGTGEAEIEKTETVETKKTPKNEKK